MAQVIETPSERVVERREVVSGGDSGAGWAMAVILVVALAVAGFIWYQYNRAPAPAAPGANINVTLPQTGGAEGTVPAGSGQPAGPAE